MGDGAPIKNVSKDSGRDGVTYQLPSDLPATPGEPAEGKSGAKDLPTDQRGGE